MRHVFFSFEYEHDVSRAFVVRNSWVTRGRSAAGFVDAADFESIKRQGDDAIRRWIDDQLNGTSVTVVLVGSDTCTSKWVKYEIQSSIERGNGLLGIDISGIRDLHGHTSFLCGQIPHGHAFYDWASDDGHANLGSWIETAAMAAGR